MPVTLAGSGASAVVVPTSPYSHFKGLFGAIQAVPGFAPVNVSASQVVTTQQGVPVFNPFPFAWLYDIAFHLDASSNHAMTLDVYNTEAAGTGANSYLIGPITVPPNVASGATGAYFTIRTLHTATAGYKLADDPFIAQALTSGASLPAWASTYMLKGGYIFSLRAITPGGSSITGLKMYPIVVPFDTQIFGQ